MIFITLIYFWTDGHEYEQIVTVVKSEGKYLIENRNLLSNSMKNHKKEARVCTVPALKRYPVQTQEGHWSHIHQENSGPEKKIDSNHFRKTLCEIIKKIKFNYLK